MTRVNNWHLMSTKEPLMSTLLIFQTASRDSQLHQCYKQLNQNDNSFQTQTKQTQEGVSFQQDVYFSDQVQEILDKSKALAQKIWSLRLPWSRWQNKMFYHCSPYSSSDVALSGPDDLHSAVHCTDNQLLVLVVETYL